MADADPDTDGKIGAFVDPDVKLSPVTPLGKHGAHIVFAMPDGEIRHEVASKVAGMLRTDIFACPAGASFLTCWRDPEGKFQREAAAIWLVRKCRDAGIWDDRRVIRSLGVWPGDPGQAILHRGEEVWTFGADPDTGKPRLVKRTIAETLRERGGPMYQLRPPTPAPVTPCSAADAGWITTALGHWRFEPIGVEGLTGVDVLAGWIPAAMLGAVAPFRGHVMIHGPAGTGKTTLARLAQALMSANCGDLIDAFTDAGLRNNLAGMARPVLIDEAEATPGANGPGLIERALELLRPMATGSGAMRKQGDIGGGSVTQTAVGAAWLGATTPPKLSPADASRFVEVRLRPINSPRAPGVEGAVTDATLAAAIERARAMSPGLLGRVLAHAGRYQADVAALKAAMSRVGQSPRAADLVAMLAAGRRLLLFDGALNEAKAEAEIAFWSPLLVQRERDGAQTNTGQDALMHLLNADSGMFQSDRRVTLTEPVFELARAADADGLPLTVDRSRKLNAVCHAHGVKVMHVDGAPWLLVANAHPALERIFGKTRWSDWRRALTELDGLGDDYATRPTRNSERFGDGCKQRALCIPLTPWLEERSAWVEVRPGTVGTAAVP